MVVDAMLLAGGVALGAAVAGLGLRLRGLGRAVAGARARCDAAVAAELAAIRLLRLSAHELRGIGMTLHGHADQAGAGGDADAAGLEAASVQLLDIADELQDHALPSVAPRILREELVDPAAVAVEAATAAAALLAPGRRHWRLPEPGATAWLWADRRALRHVLGRVLADAVRNTRNDDWIEIAVQAHPQGLRLVVEDEGAGLAMPQPGAGQPQGGGVAPDSRGIGLRLVLARSLMEAHGGGLEVEALARVGSRVSLTFPAARVRARAGADAIG